MKAELGLSAEDIEEALISPNNDLARLHIALLKVFLCSLFPITHHFKEMVCWINLMNQVIPILFGYCYFACIRITENRTIGCIFFLLEMFKLADNFAFFFQYANNKIDGILSNLSPTSCGVRE